MIHYTWRTTHKNPKKIGMFEVMIAVMVLQCFRVRDGQIGAHHQYITVWNPCRKHKKTYF